MAARKRSQPSSAHQPPSKRARVLSLSPTTEQGPGDLNCLNKMSDDILTLATQNESVMDALGELQERFATFEEKFTTFLEHPQTQDPTQAHLTSGMTLLETIAFHFPWLNNPPTIINNIIEGSLNVNHLIKLVPPEECSKSQNSAAGPTGLTFDLETGKSSLVTEYNIAYEKHFPDFATLISALSVYCAVRSISDIDNTGIGFAISAHIWLLSSWYHLGYALNRILMYEIAFLRRYQTSYVLSDWAEVREQLFTYHITRATILPPAAKKSSSSHPASETVCRNYNSKGCSYKACIWKHVCSSCSSIHPLPDCKLKSHSHQVHSETSQSYLSINNSTNPLFVSHRDPISVPHRDFVSVPHRNFVPVPHRDLVSVPHRDLISVPHRNSVPVPHRDLGSVPHRDFVSVPHRDSVSVPHRNFVSVPHRDFIPAPNSDLMHSDLAYPIHLNTTPRFEVFTPTDASLCPTSSIIPDCWRHLLQHYPDRQFPKILAGIATYSAQAGYEGPLLQI